MKVAIITTCGGVTDNYSSDSAIELSINEDFVEVK